MTDHEYQGVITSVQPTSANVKVQLDTVPGKVFTYPMAAFLSKPRPEVGKRLVCTARPGAHDELHVQQLISITDPPKQAVHTEVGKTVSTEIDPTTLPLPSDATTLEHLAKRILELKFKCKEAFAQGLLDFKWQVGHEISAVRVQQEPATFRELEKLTAIRNDELVRCVQFYKKYPNHDFDLKAWRKVIAELPAGKEPVKESPSALVVDTKHLWVCPTCGVKFEQVHVTENKHRLQECKDD